MSRLIGWFSCGAASASAIKMTLADTELLKNFDEVVVAYCYVKEEHPDNVRFLKECEQWFDYPVTILMHDGYQGSIYNVFNKNFINTPNGPPCTRALKKQVRLKFQRPTDTHLFGYTMEETERIDNFIDANNIKTMFPLQEKNITKANCLALVQRAGIEIPVMYKLGYEHNNCVGCVRGGMGYWNKIRKDFPEAFDKMAKFERLKGYTVLKDKNGPLFLDTLDPARGKMSDEPKIECGIFCEYEELKINKII
jgi:hypothetical protein